MDIDNMHGAGLRALCVQKGLDVSNVRGKEGYLKILKEHSMNAQPNTATSVTKPSIITSATLDDLKSVGISEDKIRIDKLRSDLDALRVQMKHPRKSHLLEGGGLQEKRFGADGVCYSIDMEENTIHFIGNPLGPICTTLSQPNKVILKIAAHYLGTFTWDAKLAKFAAGQGM